MKRDRCYLIATEHGPMRIRAAKKPDERTQKALRDLFKAAHRMLSDRQTADKGKL
jgi:hypothetical protein